MSIKSKIQALITAANNTTGESDTTLTDAVQTLVDGYGQGGGEEWFVSDNGAIYFEETEVTTTAEPSGTYRYAKCDHLKSLTIHGISKITSNNFSLIEGCSILETLLFPDLVSAATYFARNCPNLKTVQLGSIGHAVTGINNATSFRGANRSDLVMTVYVADGATLPLANSPWGATNATIIYRSATTGEVINV